MLLLLDKHKGYQANKVDSQEENDHAAVDIPKAESELLLPHNKNVEFTIKKIING